MRTEEERVVRKWERIGERRGGGQGRSFANDYLLTYLWYFWMMMMRRMRMINPSSFR